MKTTQQIVEAIKFRLASLNRVTESIRLPGCAEIMHQYEGRIDELETLVEYIEKEKADEPKYKS